LLLICKSPLSLPVFFFRTVDVVWRDEMPSWIRIVPSAVTIHIVARTTHPLLYSDCGCKLIGASNQWPQFCYRVAKGTWRCLIYVNSAPRYHHPPDRISLLKVSTMRNFGRKRAANMYKVWGLWSTEGNTYVLRSLDLRRRSSC